MNTQFSGWQKQVAEEKTPAKKVGDWEQDEVITGFITDTKQFSGQYGPVNYYYLTLAEVDAKGNITTNDESISLRGGAGLDNVLKGFKQGQLTMIKYLGKKKSPKSGMMFNDFEIQFANNFYKAESVVTKKVKPVVETDVEFDDIEWEDE